MQASRQGAHLAKHGLHHILVIFRYFKRGQKMPINLGIHWFKMVKKSICSSIFVLPDGLLQGQALSLLFSGSLLRFDRSVLSIKQCIHVYQCYRILMDFYSVVSFQVIWWPFPQKAPRSLQGRAESVRSSSRDPGVPHWEGPCQLRRMWGED